MPESLPALPRRRFLALAGACAWPFSKGHGQQDFVMPGEIVDAHTHFYDPTRPEGVVWPSPGSPLYRTVLPKDWKAVAGPCGVRHTVVVEASSRVEDNQWILDLAEKEPSIVAYIGFIDPASPDFLEQLNRFAANSLLKGLRLSEKLLLNQQHEPFFKKAMEALVARDLCLEVNGSYRFLQPLYEVAQAHPDLRIMVNHMGGPGSAAKLNAEWRLGMERLGALPQVHCKVSGISSQSATAWGVTPRSHGFYQELFDHVWKHFGEDRCVYGSDWPVSDRGLNYAETLALVVEDVRTRSQPSRVASKWFYENSKSFYRWNSRHQATS